MDSDTNSQAGSLPFQPMLSGPRPMEILKMDDFHRVESLSPHRHDFYMLYWTTEGTGKHRVDFRDYTMQPKRVYFLHKNQVHQVLRYPAKGWMILFNSMYFQGFLMNNPSYEQAGLFDYFNRSPWVDLDSRVFDIFNVVADILAQEVTKGFNSGIVQHYLSILLLYAGDQYLKGNNLKHNSVENDTMCRLKVLIEKNYKKNRDTLFYSEIMGMAARKLNEICFKTMGRLVPDLIADRLLSEGEALLGATNMPIKEISYELGFADQAHFAFFFKKAKNQTPSEFRKQFLSGK